jgi:hypothetical protein
MRGATPISRKLMKLGKSVKLDDEMNSGKFHSDRTTGFGSTGGLYMAFSIVNPSRLHCAQPHNTVMNSIPGL